MVLVSSTKTRFLYINSALDFTGLAVTSPSAQEVKRNQSWRHVSTIEMCSLAARVGDGRAFPGDPKLAERLILALVDRLAADSSIEVYSER
jgi:hypothetical protein